MKKYKRIFTIVIDSLGVGAMSDAHQYGDDHSNTFVHIWKSQNGLHIPNLRRLGLGNLCGVSEDDTIGYAMKCKEKSVGKDTMTGHWEMMGLHITKPFQTFTQDGFPKELMDELAQRCGRKIVGNKAASGTEILDEYGEHELATGDMIVYTSADSVLQICGHEEHMGLENLYHYCEIARELTMRDEWKVGRVIARPYIGSKKGEFKRTSNRHDYALKPFHKTILNILQEAHYDVISIGKINDIFDGEGITKAYKSKSSVHGMQQTLEVMKQPFEGLCFVNLVDFDALWGHRRDPKGYGKELEVFDQALGDVINNLQDDDALMICADHGNDPTFTGSDHTREMVPLLVYSPSMKQHGQIKTQESFGVIGVSIADNFQVEVPDYIIGTSILNKLI